MKFKNLTFLSYLLVSTAIVFVPASTFAQVGSPTDSVIPVDASAPCNSLYDRKDRGTLALLLEQATSSLERMAELALWSAQGELFTDEQVFRQEELLELALEEYTLIPVDQLEVRTHVAEGTAESLLRFYEISGNGRPLSSEEEEEFLTEVQTRMESIFVRDSKEAQSFIDWFFAIIAERQSTGPLKNDSHRVALQNEFDAHIDLLNSLIAMPLASDLSFRSRRFLVENLSAAALDVSHSLIRGDSVEESIIYSRYALDHSNRARNLVPLRLSKCWQSEIDVVATPLDEGICTASFSAEDRAAVTEILFPVLLQLAELYDLTQVAASGLFSLQSRSGLQGDFLYQRETIGHTIKDTAVELDPQTKNFLNNILQAIYFETQGVQLYQLRTELGILAAEEASESILRAFAGVQLCRELGGH